MLKFNKIYYLTSAIKPEDFPKYSYPEFAFIGRSNVGKSSLINFITGQKGLVKVGATPGVTRTINFFVANENLSLVDLPGYGYAKVPEKQRVSFMPLFKRYVENRDNLKLIFFLLDIRRKPGDEEKELITWLAEHNIPTAIVATKCDKLNNKEKKEQTKFICTELNIEEDHVFYTSVLKKTGKKELHSIIQDYSS